MRRSAALHALVALLLVAAAAVLTSTDARTAGGGQCTIPPGSLQTTTTSWLVALGVGPMEAMYSQSEANAKHLSSGEVMVGGAMSNVPGPPAPVRHLKVHICSKDGSQVVQSATPVIAVTDLTANGAAMSIPVAVMQGVGMGVADLHYGNNVVMPPDHTYLVTVTSGADRAGFKFTLGQSGITWGEPTAAVALPPTAASPVPGAMGPGGTGAMTPTPRSPSTAATPAPTPRGSMTPGGAGAASPAPATPPGTGAPTPRTGVIDGVAPAAGVGAALLGVLLCAVARRRRR